MRARLREDVEDQLRAIDDLAIEALVQLAQLRRRQLVVEDDEIGVGFRRGLRQHVDLAAAEEGRRIRPGTILQHPQDDAGAGRLREAAQLFERMFRVHSSRAAGHQTDERCPLHQHRTRFTHCHFDSSTEIRTYNRRAACMRR